MCACTVRRARRSVTARWYLNALVVAGRGDGFDEGANAFRDMPPIRSVVAFEENPEEVEGHYFYIAGEEHRVIRLDAIILSFPLE